VEQNLKERRKNRANLESKKSTTATPVSCLKGGLKDLKCARPDGKHHTTSPKPNPLPPIPIPPYSVPFSHREIRAGYEKKIKRDDTS